MKATGIVRRIDDLGRVVIPKEIRRTLRIREGDPLEIYTEANGEVIFKKYSPIGELSDFASQYAEVISKTVGCPIIISDRDHIIAAAGISKKEYIGRRISPAAEELMELRKSYLSRSDSTSELIPTEGLEKAALVMYPIISAGDVTGSVVMLHSGESREPSETEIKLTQTAAAFLGKQLEE